MAQRRKAAKTSSVNPLAAISTPDLLAHYPDLDQWPLRWRGSDQDIEPGRRIVACFRPFLAHLAANLARSTMRRHADNLWILGGEIIRDLNESPRLRKTPMDQLVFDAVDGGGLLPHHRDSEDQLRSFESTCNKFRRFLQSQRSKR